MRSITPLLVFSVLILALSGMVMALTPDASLLNSGAKFVGVVAMLALLGFAWAELARRRNG